jgi:hypothetical protein
MPLNYICNNCMEVSLCIFIMAYSASCDLARSRTCGLSSNMNSTITVLQFCIASCSTGWREEECALCRGAVQPISIRN